MQQRFRQTKGEQAAEVWVDLGILFFTVELYEGGEFVERQRGIRPRKTETEVYVSGQNFSTLVRLLPGGKVRCTWSR